MHVSKHEKERKQIILKRYLSGILLTTVAAVASLRLFQPVMIKLISLYNTADVLMYELYLEPHPDLKLETLRISVESPSEYYEQPIGIGEVSGAFNQLILGRSYVFKVKGDFGFGDQTVYETRYRLNTKPTVSMSISQSIHTLYYYMQLNDIYHEVPGEVVTISVYQNKTLLSSMEVTLDTSGFTSYSGLLEGIKADGVTYDFRVTYRERGGFQTLYETSFTTRNDPVIYGEAYMDLDTIHYFFYVDDFAHKRVTDTIRIALYDHNLKVYEQDFTLDETLNIQGIIESIDPQKIYEIKVSLYFEKGFRVIYQTYLYAWEELPHETQ